MLQSLVDRIGAELRGSASRTVADAHMPAPQRLLSYARRLARMTPREIHARSGQMAAKYAHAALSRFGVDPFRPSPFHPPRGRFFCDPEDIPRILEVLRRYLPAEVEAIVGRAESILSRRFDLLGFEGLDFGHDIDWACDPVHRRHARLQPWARVPFLDFSRVGDHKIVWELNRHQFLVTLAKAYRLTGDERFAADLKRLWYDWRKKNPYPMGINWTSTLEVAFRAHSWLWTAFLLEGTAADAAFERDLARELERAGWYIERFMSTYFAPNTHLLGEAVVLFLIALRYPDFAAAERWRDRGWRIVREEARRQVRSDGLHFEQSIYYHVYALDLFLYARLAAARNRVAIPAELDATIESMMAALAGLDQAGALPRFGDDDGGRLFDGSRNRAEQMSDPLSTGTRLFPDAKWRPANTGLCEETVWLLGPDRALQEAQTSPAVAHAVALPDAGLYAMSLAGPPVAQLFIDAGPQGSLAAGHGHADALSLQVAAAGRLWLTDPGTFCYVGPASERDRFRITSAHNTLTVDGRSQAEPGKAFSWATLPHAEARCWIPGQSIDFFEGAHDGYLRLGSPVTHRRWVIRAGRELFLVRDLAEGSGDHSFELAWHFAPELVVTADRNTVTAAAEDSELLLIPAADTSWNLRLEDYDYSPVYGRRVNARRALWSLRSPCPAEFAAVLAFGSRRDAGCLRRSTGDGAVVYEYASVSGRHRFGFASRPGPWTAGAWASDAAFLYYQVDLAGRAQLSMIRGSYAAFEGNQLFGSASPVEKTELDLVDQPRATRD